MHPDWHQPYATPSFLSGPWGNSVFSYADREVSGLLASLRIAPLIFGIPEDLAVSSDIVFQEYLDGKVISCAGLESFVHFSYSVGGKSVPVWIMDNHNHAFYFWAYQYAITHHSSRVVHIDQHSDLRPAPLWSGDLNDPRDVWKYTNQVLNIGNFIRPAQELGIIRDCLQITGSWDRGISCEYAQILGPIILDLDLDYFAPEMDFLTFSEQLAPVSFWLEHCDAVTICTSPYFLDQNEAISLVQQIFTK